MKRILSWLVLIGFAVAQISIIAPKFITAGSETMYMAVVGPMTGPDAARGKAMVDGATLMIDTLEESGILGDRDIQLIVKDDQSNPQIAMEHAAALAQDEQVMAVLGHSSDEISRATAPIYAAGGLPVVSGSSGLPLVAAENKWYFRVGLTTVQQGTFLANYMARVMQEDTLQIITAQAWKTWRIYHGLKIGFLSRGNHCLSCSLDDNRLDINLHQHFRACEAIDDQTRLTWACATEPFCQHSKHRHTVFAVC